MPQTFAKIWIVVPCYNEEHRFLAQEFQAFSKKHPEIHFLFVNDGCTDNTQGVLEQASLAMGASASVIQLPVNKGKAEAVRQGLLAVTKRMQGHDEVCGYWDADLATPLSEIKSMLHLLRSKPHIQMVMGARIMLLGKDIKRNHTRHYLGRVFATFAANVLGFAVYDTQCGAKMFRNRSGLGDLFEEPFATRWVFDVEIIARLSRAYGGSPDQIIYELPLKRWHDQKGSKVTISAMFRALFDLGRLFFKFRLS